MNGTTILPGSEEGVISNWGYGMTSTMDQQEPKMRIGKFDPAPSRQDNLVMGDRRIYFEKSKPQYDMLGQEAFVSVLNYGVSNTGNTSQIALQNTIGINKALQEAKGKVLVFPAGRYLVSDTLLIPGGSRLVGVLWSQIVATGPQFGDEYKPKVLAQ
jgi:Pectate lyase superfamily protein